MPRLGSLTAILTTAAWLFLLPTGGVYGASTDKTASAGQEEGDQITLNFQDVDIRALINTVRTGRVPSYMVELISRWKNAEQAVDGANGI